MKKIFFILLIAIFSNSCIDEDSYIIDPVPIPEITIPYNINENQTYFNLHDTLIVQNNRDESWDLGFEASSSGYHVILNYSKFMFAKNTNSTDFYGITTNTVSGSMEFDNSNGDLNSTAIGNWADFSDPLNPIFYKKVYIIDRGKNIEGISYGFKKIVFDKLENGTYTIKYANLDNSDEHTFEVVKDATQNFVHFSFNNGGELSIQEPDNQSWDLLFTKYTTLLYDNNNVPTPYPVRGVLINKELSVAADSTTNFYLINLSKTSSYNFSKDQDAVGYKWKRYITIKGTATYVVNYKYNYIIKNRQDEYFKIRFTNYFSSDGIVSFEMQRIDE